MTDLLVVTTLYPNQRQHRHGIFVETRLRRLLDTGACNATVIAPVPWFPFKSTRFRRYAIYADVPDEEERHGIRVHHPRFLVIPKIGMLLTPLFLAICILRCVRRLQREGLKFDLVDAHYYYPDGVAVALIKRALGRPFMVTARGSDINVIAKLALPRRLIRFAARRAAASIAVSNALKAQLLEIGEPPAKVHVMRNGVDLQMFRPPDVPDRTAGNKPVTLVSVGNLIELKGHHLVIAALPFLEDCELLVVGDGEQRDSLETRARDLDVADRVTFLGTISQAKLVEVYRRAKILVLASRHEGMPNVLLEAMACDTPVVATAVGGIPEIVCAPEAGVLVEHRTVDDIVNGIQKLLATYPVEGATRTHAERFSWEDTVSRLLALNDEILEHWHMEQNRESQNANQP